jgi:hypothetical protein
MNETYLYKPLKDPDRLEVRDKDNNFLALFTNGAYTVTLDGPERTLCEIVTREDSKGTFFQEVSVKHTTWVRTYKEPFTGELDTAWLEKALEANKQEVPDILAIAMQYIENAPPIFENGLQIAGDAEYGPEEGGVLKKGSDFNDYLGITWDYKNETPPVKPKSKIHSLDCSGFIRMVWGYRHNFLGSGYTDNIPLAPKCSPNSDAIPRRSVDMYKKAPGIVIILDQGTQVSKSDFEKLRIGDLVFFDGHTEDKEPKGVIDHVGIFMGLDGNEHRFISSRKKINGPTMSDCYGKSVLNGDGHFAKAFRAARRL